MAGFVKGFNPVIISGSAEWAGSSAWYADETGQAEERPVCKPSKWSRDRKVAGSNPARSTKNPLGDRQDLLKSSS
jgi:hypothetical protein